MRLTSSALYFDLLPSAALGNTAAAPTLLLPSFCRCCSSSLVIRPSRDSRSSQALKSARRVKHWQARGKGPADAAGGDLWNARTPSHCVSPMWTCRACKRHGRRATRSRAMQLCVSPGGVFAPANPWPPTPSACLRSRSNVTRALALSAKNSRIAQLNHHS